AMSVAYDSSRPELDEARRAWPAVRFVFHAHLAAHSQAPPILNKFVLFFSDDEDGTRRGAHDALGRAADAKMSPAGVAVGRDHDKIDVHLLGRFGDLVGCMPDTHR